MSLTKLTISNLRLYQQQEISPDQNLNVVHGNNASGKTSLLEAIHVLSTGRSFRGTQITPLIRHGSESMTVAGEVLDPTNTYRTKLSIRADEHGRHLAVDNQKSAKISEFAKHLPVLVISPDSHFQFHQKSRARRAVMDWSLFHVEPAFGGLWVRYQRAVQQRNSALKDPKQRKTQYSWDPEISELGEKIQAYRETELTEISKGFSEVAGQLLDDSSKFEIRLKFGWDRDRGLAGCLSDDRNRDQERGITHSGPHRNDIELLASGIPAEDEASHGQNKLMLIALRLAQIQRLFRSADKRCCLLIDDLPAELDNERRQLLSGLLATMPVQVFVTTTDVEAISTKSWTSHSLFHVEQGTIKC